jgi:AcrR family transcriptional regulator
MAGRPRRTDPSKGPQILDVSLETFAEHGFQATTMDMIATQAGMSKQTLYRYFENKLDLFTNVVRLSIARASIEIGATPARTEDELRATLQNALEQIAAGLGRDESVQIFRMVISESGRQESLGQYFFEEISKVAARPLARVLSVAHDRGLIEIEEPFEGSIRLIAQVKEYFLWPALLGRPPALVRPNATKVIATVVDEFLRAHPPRPPTVEKRLERRPSGTASA